MAPDAGRIRIALRLQAVAGRADDMDRTHFADSVCDAVDAAGRLGYLGRERPRDGRSRPCRLVNS